MNQRITVLKTMMTLNEYNDKYCFSDLLPYHFLNKYIHRQPEWGYDGLGYIVYKRTYSRTINESLTEEWWQTVSRCINGAQKIGADYTPEEAQRLFDLIFNLKCNFGGRMLWQLGTSTVDRFGLASLLNCFTYDTEIITEKGIKQIGELSGSEHYLMSTNGKYIKSEVKSFGTQEIWEINLTKGKSKKTIRTTANHRWFRKPYRVGEERKSGKKIEITTSQLKAGDKLISTFGQSIKGNISPSPYGIIAGIVFGDGSVCNNVGQVRLCGEKDSQLLKYFLTPRIYNYDGDIIIGNLPKFFKEKPSLDMDKSYLYGWLAGYFAADGCVSSSGQIRISSSNKNNLLFVRDVLVKLGIGYSPIIQQDRIGIGQTEESPLYSLNIMGCDLKEDFFLIESHKTRFINTNYKKKNNWKVESIINTENKEEVYCAIVPDKHEFVLESNILTGNCFFVAMREPEDFCFLFEHLMLGGGVGYSVKREDIHELPRIKKGVTIFHYNEKDADFIVPDSRQGWVELLRKTLNSFFISGKSFNYSTILVRGAGEPIKGFGGTASGPQILIEGLQSIIQIFQKREGKKLRSIDVLDINNIIGSIVVAGNVRRSAEVAIGDPDDYLYIRAKNWSDGTIPNWRAMSNNSIYADTYDHISSEIWSNGYILDKKTGNAKGEPYGFMNLPLSKKYGRLGEERPDNCEGGNPCMEITLADGEACNLSELYLNNISSKEELIECSRLLYKTQKAVWTLPSLYEKTNIIGQKNMRIGQGVTGVCQSLDKLDWLDECYTKLREFDEEWSKKKGWNESIKLTTIKPSGTLSLLGGSTPGVHPAYSKYYIRRVRMSTGDPLVKICQDRGYKTEYVIKYDGSGDYSTVIVEFPCNSGEDTIITSEMPAIKQLELVKKLQTVWSDNSVSVTVYYHPEELEDIQNWMKNNYESSSKTLSFLLHAKHGFIQAPLEEIDEKTYQKLVKRIKPMEAISSMSSKPLDGIECEGGACPIR